ncbi:hypothetical protein A2954_02690 [Candidatus Roizmanbacteria bacterium RIFCSPLOWO2_01_FULL_37_12]|uniref:Uncharacterized protein n=1 Tax=Candidatus Roizmanbacteria bacterium RIFCSPLOWO2_01_FULL_37_12 TaxID=1802056 RepID=A0A1F7IF12_9BACT|nr:MAG: hypothetical protein A2767_02215 [Candidatus Roizmanbacteria bacterium RIFCSPHIGHO2_01_FULL_35_10]OGK41932.1 MAG: hypothetical protein A2954_02690 [Candidatus Roizmanbacteria bacterium RIFCSPLOWO2_01_FULL_37_12]
MNDEYDIYDGEVLDDNNSSIFPIQNESPFPPELTFYKGPCIEHNGKHQIERLSGQVDEHFVSVTREINSPKFDAVVDYKSYHGRQDDVANFINRALGRL